MSTSYPDALDGTVLRKMLPEEQPLTFVPNHAYSGQNAFNGRIVIDSVHGGDAVPEDYWQLFEGYSERRQEAYFQEKDWAANHVAYELTRRLDLSGFYKVEIARVLLDYNRFPGITPPNEMEHLHRLCIVKPISESITRDQARRLLQTCYDPISAGYEKFVQPATLKVSIHTYDTYNPMANTKRPATSVLYRPLAYQNLSRMPFGVFDRLYIDELGEFTADRKLINRLGLTFEKANVAMDYNYPYMLPAGSIEVRAQVWRFFQFLKNEFEKTYPETIYNESFQAVWRMLTDTNFRDGESEILRSYIHALRHPPVGFEEICKKADEAYQFLSEYMRVHREGIKDLYRYHPQRLSCIGIEVRKDLVWDFQAMKPKNDIIQRISGLLAEGILRYFETDYPF
jgi:hypothetical protein